MPDRHLDDEQRTTAREGLGCGLTLHQVARHFHLTESELRAELGLPPAKPEAAPVTRPWHSNSGGPA